MRQKKINNRVRCAVLIAAGGSGRRMGAGVRKQFIEVAGKSLLRHTVELFASLAEVTRIVVALPPEEVERFNASLTDAEKERVVGVAGGLSRQESVFNGLAGADANDTIVLRLRDAAVRAAQTPSPPPQPPNP